MTVGELLQRMDAAEFGEWLAFAEDEPFGGVVEDYRAGLVASAVTNKPGFGERPRSVKPMEWFPWHDPDKHMTDEEHEALLDAILEQASR